MRQLGGKYGSIPNPSVSLQNTPWSDEGMVANFHVVSEN
jgi:hypothetical protein